MCKLKFSIKLFLLILVVFTTNLTVNPRNSRGNLTSLQSELRGTWLNPSAFRTNQTREKTLDNVVAANLNTVFIATPSIGSHYGWSTVEEFVPTILYAKSLGLSVHIWIANHYRTWSENHELIDFRNDTERDMQRQWVIELLNEYNDEVDGIHFDYIRYKGWEEVNNESKMDAVTETVKRCYEAIQEQHATKFLTSTCFDAYPNYANYEREDIPKWFLDWMNANPGNEYTSSECPNGRYVPHHMKYQQNPVSWIKTGIVDAIIPMKYTTNDTYWNREVHIYKSFLNEKEFEKVFMGLGWYEDKHDAASIVRKIVSGRSLGINGFVIFEFGNESYDEMLVEALTENSELNNYNAPFKNPIDSCLFKEENNDFWDFKLQETELILIVVALGVIVILSYLIVRKFRRKLKNNE